MDSRYFRGITEILVKNPDPHQKLNAAIEIANLLRVGKKKKTNKNEVKK